MSINVGSVSVTVVPDASLFGQKLRDAVRDQTVTVRVDADIADAKAKIDALGGDKAAKVGVDLDDADASARLDDLTRTRDAKVNVDADTGAAEAKLNRLGDSASSGGSGINSLMGAALALGPALVPVGAAALAGAAAFGTLAAAGAGAAGVLAIAFSGVPNALKLLDQQQTQSAAAGAAASASVAQHAQAVVSAQRQMESAQMSLGDAERNAAQQQISDAQAVQNAQRGLATANDQVTIAQQALTAAQEAGRRELESFANNAADASLAQRQAVISLEAAQANLAKTSSSATATDIQRQQAALDVAKAQQSLTEANQRVTQTTQDNTAAQAKGLDGTQAVVSAHKQLTSAQDNQQKATQTLADAQRKAAADQVTSQEAIVRAQQGVAAAAEAMAAAQRQSAGTTSAALQATNDKIAKLDPATRDFAEYLRGTWVPIWKSVQAAASGGLLPGVQAGLENLIPVMPGFTSLIGKLAQTMGDLFQQGTAALAGPFWQHFMSDIGQALPGLLTALVHSIENIGHGFAGIVDAFLPMSKQIADGLVGLTQKFADWGSGLANSPGFHSFVQSIQDNWPTIRALVENVATAVGHLLQAGNLLGGPYLEIFRQLSGVLAGLPVGVVEALVLAFTGFKVFQTITPWISGAGKALDGLAEKSIPGVSRAAGGLSSALPAIGSALAILGTAWSAQQSMVDDWSASVAKGGDAAAKATAQMADSKRSIADAHSLGDAWGIVKAAFADGGAQLQGYSSIQDEVAKGAKKLYDAMTPQQQLAQDVANAQDNLNKVLADPNHSAAEAALASENLRAAQNRQQTQTDLTKASTKSLTDAIYDNVSAAEAAAGSALGFQSSLLSTQGQIDKYTAGIKNGTIAQADRAQAENDVATSIRNTVLAAGKQAEADNVGKTAAEIHKASVDAQRAAFEELTKRLGFVPPALQGVADSLDAAGSHAAITSGKMEDLGLKVIGLPNSHSIVISAPTEKQMSDLNALGLRTTTLPNGNVQVDADTKPAQDALTAFLAQHRTIWVGTQLDANGQQRPVDANGNWFVGPIAPHKADGGHIVGPGTETSDSIPARLSHNEYVVKAASVRKYGVGFLDAVNAGRFAEGGLVATAQMDPASMAATGLQAIAAARQMLLSGVGGQVALPPGGSVERWRPVVDQVLTLLHQPLAMDNGVLSLIQHESGGNPVAINLSDSNFRAGHPSQGLMQTIPSTFAANAGPFAGRGITDPLANTYAGVHYALQRWGAAMLMSGGRHDASGHYIGYDAGGTLDPGYHMVYNGTGATEIVAPRQTFEQVMSGASGGSGPSSFTGNLYLDSGEFLGVVRGVAQQENANTLNSMASIAKAGARR